jgi:2-(1,2-epoxy-1,2-dihydrophenyl)acetyl-CoA isomerase
MALRRIKKLMRDSVSRDLPTHLVLEGKAQVECLRSEDFIEGVQAFFQKRPGVFNGR